MSIKAVVSVRGIGPCYQNPLSQQERVGVREKISNANFVKTRSERESYIAANNNSTVIAKTNDVATK
jgi:hypothetical protein